MSSCDHPVLASFSSTTLQEADVMRGFPVPPERRVSPATVFQPPFTRWFMQHVRETERTAAVGFRARRVLPLRCRQRNLSGLRVSTPGGPLTLDEVLKKTCTDGFIVLRRGVVIDERYFGAMRPDTPHMWQSVSKSLGSCVAGNLVVRHELDPSAKIASYVPELEGSAYGGALVQHLLDMMVAIDYSEDYDDPDSDASRLDRLYGVRSPTGPGEPGSTYDFAKSKRGDGTHGERFAYVSLNINVLGWVMERATGLSVPGLIRREIWDHLGGEYEAYIALDGAGSAQLEGGFCSSLRDLARFGMALCSGGRLGEKQIIPAEWVSDVLAGGDWRAFASSADEATMPGASYKNCFWVSCGPRHTCFMGLGIYGQMLYVNPSAEVVVAKFSCQPCADGQRYFAKEFAAAEALADFLAT
jgi:CubicO group peptidase (beta-lactamase class C family)